MARIGLISYGADRPTSGITRYTQEMISALRKNRMPVTVLHAGSVIPQQDVIPLRGSARAPALLTLGQAEIAWSAWRHNLSLIHDPTGTAPLVVTRAKRVATIHDVIPYIYPETSTLLERVIYHYWLPIATRKLHAVVTDSHQSKIDIVRYLRVNADRTTVVPLGVDARYQPLDPVEVRFSLERRGIAFPYILYVSPVGPRSQRKNLPRLLEAYARLRERPGHWRLVIVGSVRKDYRPVFEVVERMKLEPDVHFTGFVADEDLPTLYNGASLFVLPSLYEGFGLPVLEAMACGVPVVTSNISSLPEVAGDAALLVDPYSVTAIADAMQKVLSDPSLAAELRERGLARARMFSWEETARKTIAVYERVLGQRIV